MAAASQIVSFRLPFPPSVNCLYDGGKKTRQRFKSDTYDKWCREARQYVMAYKADNPGFVTMRNKVAAWYRHGEFFDKRVRDAENYTKAISDLLVEEGILEDDALIKRTVGDWADDVDAGMSEIVIVALSRMVVTIVDHPLDIKMADSLD